VRPDEPPSTLPFVPSQEDGSPEMSRQGGIRHYRMPHPPVPPIATANAILDLRHVNRGFKKTVSLEDLAALAGVPEDDLEFVQSKLLTFGIQVASLEHLSGEHDVWRRGGSALPGIRAALARLLDAAVSLRYDAILVESATRRGELVCAREERVLRPALNPRFG
jgi:hypothetical protein